MLGVQASQSLLLDLLLGHLECTEYIGKVIPYHLSYLPLLVKFLIKGAKTKGLIRGVEIGRDKGEVTHVRFADDTLIFFSKDESVIINFRRVLDCFSVMSRMKINYKKLVFVSWNSSTSFKSNFEKSILDKSSYLRLEEHN